MKFLKTKFLETMKFLKTPWGEVLITVLIALIVFAGVRVTLQSFIVRQQSMEPSFHDGQYILANKLTYHFSSPKRGDVIIFHYPLNPSELYIKRVIGLPGERVEIVNGRVYIDEGKGSGFQLLEEPEYIPSIDYQMSPTPVLPPDEYFVLGDNRNNSSDSHVWGTVPRENIIGKTWLRYWPPSKWGLSPSYSFTLQ